MVKFFTVPFYMINIHKIYFLYVAFYTGLI
jgi:hypothetical protein